MSTPIKTFSRLALIFILALITTGVIIGLNLSITNNLSRAADYLPTPSEKIQSSDVMTAYVYLPVVMGGSGNPNPAPTPNPTVTPPSNAAVITPSVAASLQSVAKDYPTALAGTGFALSGTDAIHLTPPEQRSYINLSLIQCNVFGQAYQVNRLYFEFDTTNISTNFSKAYLSFKNYPAWPGPPPHYVNIWSGSWPQLLQSGTYETNPAVWGQYGLMQAHVQGAWNNQTEQVTIELPKTVVNAGGTTRLAFTTSTEGSQPMLYSCLGNNPALGGAFSIPYLLIE